MVFCLIISNGANKECFNHESVALSLLSDLTALFYRIVPDLVYTDSFTVR